MCRDERWTVWRGARRAAVVLGAATVLAAAGAPRVTRAATAAFEVTPTVGWQWGGTLDYSAGGDVHANAALNYGGTIGAMIRPGEWYEVGYSYQATDLIGRPPGAPEFKVFDLATHYIQIAGGRNLMPAATGRAWPYVIGGLGMTIFSPGTPTVPLNPDTQYLFSASLGGGVRVTVNERVDLRLQTRLLLPMNFTEGSFYFGSGGGAVSVSGGTVMPQGEATLGITIRGAGSVTVTN
jgi:hypothetical protein